MRFSRLFLIFLGSGFRRLDFALFPLGLCAFLGEAGEFLPAVLFLFLSEVVLAPGEEAEFLLEFEVIIESFDRESA